MPNALEKSFQPSARQHVSTSGVHSLYRRVFTGGNIVPPLHRDTVGGHLRGAGAAKLPSVGDADPLSQPPPRPTIFISLWRWVTAKNLVVWVGLLLMLLLAACGSSIEPPDNLPTGYTLARGDRVAIGLPDEWTATQPTPDDFRALAEDFRDTNPEFAARIDELAEEIQADTLRLAAYHDDGLTSLNITSEGVRFYQTTGGQANANRAGLEEAGYQILEKSTATLNGHTAARTEAEITVSAADGRPFKMRLLQYTMVVGNRAYSISFGTPSPLYDDFETEFEQIASTFHTVESVE